MNEDKTLDNLENTIIVLETMVFGKGFCRTEILALQYAIEYLTKLKDYYIKNKKGNTYD